VYDTWKGREKADTIQRWTRKRERKERNERSYRSNKRSWNSGNM